MSKKVNFKRSLTGLNSEFSFSLTGCLTEAKYLCLSYYLPIAVSNSVSSKQRINEGLTRKSKEPARVSMRSNEEITGV